MIWHTQTLREYMKKYYKIRTDPNDPNFVFIEKLKELWQIIDSADLSKFTDYKTKVYDLYPLREVFEQYDDGNNRFNLEQMADAGEAYDEILNIIFNDWSKANVKIKLEKQYICKWGVSKTFPLDDSCMML